MKPQNSPAASDEVAPTTPVEQPAETPATPETTPAETQEDEPEEEETPETPAEPVAPEASAPGTQRLTAFDRGALRFLGKGDLVARTERAEAELARLAAENTRLSTELAQFKATAPKQIAAAAAGRKNEVAKGVAAELAGLGISPEAAPGVVGATEAEEKLMPYEAFQSLSHEKRNEFIRNGGKIQN